MRWSRRRALWPSPRNGGKRPDKRAHGRITTMRIAFAVVMMAALGACAPAIPDSGAGVGFKDYNEYQREKEAREAALAGNALPAPDAVSSEPLDATGEATGGSDAERLAAET